MAVQPGREDDAAAARRAGDPDRQPDARLAEFERRLLACPTLPSLPAVAAEILRLCREDETDLRQIAEVIATDPALAARVLRAGNSAALGARAKVTTLHRAVALLGSNAVLSIALSFTLLRDRRSDARDGFDRACFWRRAVLSALAARALAEITAPSSVDPEEAFVAALLQDVGMLALAEVFRERYGYLCAHAGCDHDAVTVLERDVWGADHAAASALLARAWRLPRVLERAIAASHDGAPPGAPAADCALVDCVALSGKVADAWVAPSGSATAVALDAARMRVGVTTAALEAVVARMALEVPDAAAEFDIDLGGRARSEELLAEARRLLRAAGLPEAPDEPPRAPAPEVAPGTPFEIAFAYARDVGEPVALLLASGSDPQEAPDAAYAALRDLLRPCLRPIDLVEPDGRGGAVVLLPETGARAARTLAERVLARARRRPLHLGVAASEPGAPAASLEALHAAASAALATACARGGGVESATPPVDRDRDLS